MGLFNHILQMCLPTEWPRQPFQAEEVDLSFTPHTVSHQQRADSPLWTKNSHLTLPLGFVTRAFGWVRPQGTKKTKIERKKKAGSERNKITEQLQADSCPHSLLLKHANWNSPLPWTLPIPMGFRQLREALTKTVSLWRWRRFWELWMPERDSYPCEGSSAKNRESWHPLSWHWGWTICQTRWQTPGFRSPHLALPSGKLFVDEAHLVLRGGALCVFLGEGTGKPERRPAGLSYWFSHNKSENRGNKHPSFPPSPEPWCTAAIQSIPFRWHLWGSECSPPHPRA